MTIEVPVPVRERPADPDLLAFCPIGGQATFGALLAERKARIDCYEKKIERLNDWFDHPGAADREGGPGTNQ